MRPNELLFAEVSADRSMVRLTAKAPVRAIRFVGCSMYLTTSARPGEVGNTFMFTGSKDRGGVAVLRVSHPDIETRLGEVETDLFIRFHPFNEKGERVDLKSEYVPTSAILAQVVSQKNNFGLRVLIDSRFYSNIQYVDQLSVRHVTEVNLLVSYVAGDVASDTVIAAAEAFHRSVIDHLTVKKDALVPRIAKLQGEITNLEQIKKDALEQSKVRHKKLIESGVSDAGIEYDSRIESLRAHYIDSATRIETKKCLISDFEAELRTVEERMLQLQDAFNAPVERTQESTKQEVDDVLSDVLDRRRAKTRKLIEASLHRSLSSNMTPTAPPPKKRSGWVRRAVNCVMDFVDPPRTASQPPENFGSTFLTAIRRVRTERIRQIAQFSDAIASLMTARDRIEARLQKIRDRLTAQGVSESKFHEDSEYSCTTDQKEQLNASITKHLEGLRTLQRNLVDFEDDIEGMQLTFDIANLKPEIPSTKE